MSTILAPAPAEIATRHDARGWLRARIAQLDETVETEEVSLIQLVRILADLEPLPAADGWGV